MAQPPKSGTRPEWLVPTVSMATGFTLGIVLIVATVAVTRHGSGKQKITSASFGTSASSTASQPAGPSTSTQPTRSTALSSSVAPTTASPTMTSAATSTATSNSAVSSAPAGSTVTQVIRPVTAAGEAAAGWTVDTSRDLPTSPINCAIGAAAPSVAAVSPNIFYCSPTAAGADACWKSATAGKMLCLSDPRSHTLVQLTVAANPGTVSAPLKPTPIELELTSGVWCHLRNGGAWSTPAAQPTWVGFYSCTGDLAVWAARTSANGIDSSHALWSVVVGSISGTGQLRTEAVTTAYYVGTATN